MAITAAVVVGAAITAYATVDAANAQADQAEKEAKLKEQQADEINKRQQINEEVMRRRALDLESEQSTKFAAAGVDIGTGAPLQLVAQNYDNLERDIQASRREAQFNSYVLGQEAGGLRSVAGGTVQRGYLGAGATLLSAGSSIYQYKNPKRPPKE